MGSEGPTDSTRARYNRLAPIYDVMGAVVEHLVFRHWRKRLWSHVDGHEILEVGVGTGKNIPYHPEGSRVTALDISERMLDRACERDRASSRSTRLTPMDAQRLRFPDDSFDAATATFVFCSVADAVRGLAEIRRVTKPGARVTLLEHVRVNLPVVGVLMDLFDPLILRLIGPHINRRTVVNVRRAGLEVEQIYELAPCGLVKLIEARSP